MAKFTNKSIYNEDLIRTMEFPQYEQDEFNLRLLAYRTGQLLIEDAFPNISMDGLDFIRYGIVSGDSANPNDAYHGGNTHPSHL